MKEVPIMFVKQISVFVENKTGRLAEIMNLLKESSIDIKALTVADTADFGIIRLVVNDTEKAISVLKNSSCTATVTDVIAFTISDEPGALYEVMDILQAGNVNIKYLYAVNGKSSGKADFVVRVSDNEAALKALTESGVTVISHKEICGE